MTFKTNKVTSKSF